VEEGLEISALGVRVTEPKLERVRVLQLLERVRDEALLPYKIMHLKLFLVL
jgi:hypothetical protein